MKNLNQPNVRRNIVKFLLVMVLIFVVAHWSDIKKGAVDGFNEGFSNSSK
jgi:hypothetical protein